VDQFFDSALRDTAPTSTGNLPMAMWQDEQAFYLEVDVPGVQQEGLQLEVHNRVLKLNITRQEVTRPDGYDNRRYGTQEQRVALPQSLDEGSIEAKLANGVLSIRIAKVEEAKPRKVDIQLS
jgi:HSP20 family protein